MRIIIKTTTPLVSIIMPCYNSEKYISQSIESVLNQTYNNFELIIVDDCSTDKSRDIIKEFAIKDKRIKYEFSKVNEGVSITRNKAIEKAKGTYIAFLDSDDIWFPNKLDTQVNFMEDNRIEFSCCDYELISEQGIKLNKKVSVPRTTNYNNLLRYNTIGCLTVMINKEKIKNIHMKDIYHEDYIAWLDIAKQGYIIYGIQETLALYRKQKSSISSNKLNAAKYTWYVLRHVENISFIKSIECFSIYAIKNIKKHIL